MYLNAIIMLPLSVLVGFFAHPGFFVFTAYSLVVMGYCMLRDVVALFRDSEH